MTGSDEEVLSAGVSPVGLSSVTQRGAVIGLEFIVNDEEPDDTE